MEQAMKRLFAWFKKACFAKPCLPLPQNLMDLLPAGKAFECRGALEAWVISGGVTDQATASLLARANDAGWTEDEIEKIHIYIEFFSSRNASAYTRIIAKGFEKLDFDLFMVACFSLYVLDRFDEAYVLLSTLEPDDPRFSGYPSFLSFAGFIVMSAGKPISEAVHYLDIGLPNGLSETPFLTNASSIYFEAGELDKVELIRKKVHEAKMGDPQIIFALSCIELARDYYPEGFRLAEARYGHPDVERHMNKELLARPRWCGEDLRGKRLLVHGEQGLGDTVMCARYISLLTEAGIGVVLDCQDAAVSLIEHNYPEIQVVNRDTPAAVNLPFDFWVGAMSLPHLLNSTAATVPGGSGYMTVSDEHRTHWRKRVSDSARAGNIRVGVAWSGNPRHRSDRRRSIGLDAMFSYIQKSQGIQFYALQTSVPEFLPENLIDFSDEMMTLSDTSALILEMDLVITVDTSIVHLAGALGKAAWLLFPYRYEWRWGLEGEKNSWYESVRVIRQESHGDWLPVLSKVFDEMLPELVTNHPGGVQ